MNQLINILFIIFCVTFVTAIDINADVDKVYADCGTNVDCAEQKFVQIIDRVDDTENLELLDGVKIVKKEELNTVGTSRGNEGLLERAARYISEHEVKIEAPKVIKSAVRALSSEPRRRKIRKILLPILLLLKLKAIIIIPIVLTVIGLIALKGLGAALAALTLSGFTALKGILDGKQLTEKRVTFGIIPPYLSHEPHWSRTGIPSLDYAELADPYYRPHVQ